MTDLTPRAPQDRKLFWPDHVLDLQERIVSLQLDEPLYIVGGAVRDAFLHRPVTELDLATPVQAISIARRITNALSGDIYVMDAERGVARVLLTTDAGAFTLDVANFRGDDLLSDLQGRDFTANAIAVDLHGDLNSLIDPLQGADATRQKILQRCTPQSIADDPIRGLRAVRQSVQLGFRIAPETQADIRLQAAQLMATSAERVRDEFFNLLSVSRPAMALRVAHSLGLLAQIIPEINAMVGSPLPSPHVFTLWDHTLQTVQKLKQLIDVISYKRTDHTAASFGLGMVAMQFDRFRAELNDYLGQQWPNERSHKTLLLLGAILHRSHFADDLPDTPEQIVKSRASALRLSGDEIKHLTNMVRSYSMASALQHDDVVERHRFWYEQRSRNIDAVLLGLADYLATYGAEIRQDQWLEQVERAVVMLNTFFNQYDTVVSPEPLIDGHALMRELQLKGSPLIGELLTRIREGQVRDEVKTYDDALNLARHLLAN